MSAGMLLRHGLKRPEGANQIDRAVALALREHPTRDLGGRADTQTFTRAVLSALETSPAVG